MTMRIALVVHDARPGGGQDRYVLELANRLGSRHEVTLFARTAVGLGPGVRFQQIAAPSRPLVLLARMFARRAWQAVNLERWDVVHTVGGALPGAGVVTAQYCHRAADEAARRWPSEHTGRLESAYRRLDSYFAANDELAAARHPGLRALIGVSRRTLNEWKAAYRPAAAHEAVVPNGVDAERFRPAEPEERAELRRSLGLQGSARIMLLVGALVRKGVETALQALAQLGDDVHLVAVGAGPHERIRATAQHMGVAARLQLLDPLDDIERFFAGADLFLFPSRYEPFGMVVAEAWAAGLPVVASGPTGALEWATPNEDAIIIADPTDAGGFADAARRILGDPALAARMAQRGRELAKRFTWEQVAQETESVYRRVQDI